jgi:type IV secretory pathway TrbF-like protein
MRAVGLIGLVLALAIVGLLVKKQMSSIAAPALSSAPASGSAPTGDARAQSQQIQQQFKQSLDAAMQQRPPVPDDN